ncbi:hypothetical protein [Schinkia azotoformans]|uniref:hypothetical protein n=1 Tax=Schinkia azotoformans TaxID=1454 RepID=UPI002DBCB3C7|nr:hypothetical protein [Schinkia azotoformans]MEC1719089.1 hypothetical protein [Schinkia azotoformans]MED4413863.1 hypothetical protein [Schinkia azotoformans]
MACSASAAGNQSSKRGEAEHGSFVLKSADGRGGIKIPKHVRKGKRPLIIIPVSSVEKSLAATGTRGASSAAESVMLNHDFWSEDDGI